MKESGISSGTRKDAFRWIAAGLTSAIAVNVAAWFYWPRLEPLDQPLDRVGDLVLPLGARFEVLDQLLPELFVCAIENDMRIGRHQVPAAACQFVRQLARRCAEAYLAQREALSYPLGNALEGRVG